MTTCYLCGEPHGKGQRETRPYGQDGQAICFGCMMGKPGAEDTAKRQFGNRLAEAGDVAVVGDGPVRKATEAEELDLVDAARGNKEPALSQPAPVGAEARWRVGPKLGVQHKPDCPTERIGSYDSYTCDCAEAQPAPVGPEARWRVGRKLGRTLYLDGRCVGMVDTTDLARQIVDALNDTAAELAELAEALREYLVVSGPYQHPAWHNAKAVIAKYDAARTK